jgi:hypothetical protein
MAVPVPVVLDQVNQPRPPGPPAPSDVAGGGLALLDVHVGIEGQLDQIVGRVAGHQALAAPMVGKADLMGDATLDAQGRHPVGDQDAGFDGRP